MRHMHDFGDDGRLYTAELAGKLAAEQLLPGYAVRSVYTKCCWFNILTVLGNLLIYISYTISLFFIHVSVLMKHR